ncbi:MAG: hypothetical protein SAQ54_02520 [Oscillatoria sp. PMC 1050.18]|nr:hypothetical protein [Oscillatoria sp. PMC 1050.18]
MRQLISKWIGKLTLWGWMLAMSVTTLWYATLISLPAYQPSSDLGTPDRTTGGGTRVICTSSPIFGENFS